MSNKLKHLDYIQQIIGRMANNSFVLKGWSITLISALFAFSKATIDYRITIIALFLVVMFWALDGYFLAKENIFRVRFNEVRLKKESDIDFSMEVESLAGKEIHWYASIWSETLLFFYGAIICVVCLFDYFM